MYLKQQGRRCRRAVEFAVVMPVIVLLFFGMVQCGRALKIQHTVVETAQAACRIYASPDGTQTQAQSLIDTSMTAAGLSGHTVTFDPATKSGITSPMQPVTVTVSYNYNEGLFVGKQITSSCVLPADVN